MPKDWPGSITDGANLVDADGKRQRNTGEGGVPYPGIEERVKPEGAKPGPDKMDDASPYSKPGKSSFDY